MTIDIPLKPKYKPKMNELKQTMLWCEHVPNNRKNMNTMTMVFIDSRAKFIPKKCLELPRETIIDSLRIKKNELRGSKVLPSN